MALPADFSKIYGSTATGGLTPISDVNYAKGWEFVGSNPPTKNDFSYLQNLSDLKSQWLYSNKLQRTDPFGDIKSDGAMAVAVALANLGLGEAAKRDVGTGANQIPDMSSFVFSVSGGVNIYRFPNRMCIQWGNSNTDSNGGAIVSLPVAMSAYVPVVIEGLSGSWTGSGGVYDFFTVYGAQVYTTSSFLAKSSSYRGSDGKFVAQSTNFNWVVVGTI